MNAVREVWQKPAIEKKPPAPLSLALQEMTARLIGRGRDQPARHLMLVGAASGVGTTFVAGHWAALLSRVFPNVLLIECRAEASDLLPATSLPLVPAAPATGQAVTRLRLPDSVCLATLAGAGTTAEWQQAFDLVLWDMPPVTASPAALLLARHVDGIVLLAQANRTRRQVALNSVQRLQESGGNVLGVVLNRTLNFVPNWLYRLL